MRSPLLLFAVPSLTISALTAQQPPTPVRLGLAVGPAWRDQLTGLQLRAEYSLMRDRWLGLRVDLGGRWTPTQSYSASTVLYGDGGHYDGTAQAADVYLGLATILSPWSRAPVSPYLVAGVAAVQSWNSGRGAYRYADGSLALAVPSSSWTRGDLVVVTGVGLRLRLGGRPILLEVQRYGQTRAFTLGTALRF